MIEFGKTLQRAREAKGYTLSQVAEMTRLKTSLVDGLENEDFSGIAAPIYGRGFVKLYCGAVGIDPKPLVEEFMAILNGNREVVIRERPSAAEPSAEPCPAPAAPIPPVSPVPEPDLFSQPEPVTPAAPVPPPPVAPAATPEPSFSRFAAPLRENEVPLGTSFANPRIFILAGCAFALLVILALGIRALYRATTSSDAEKPDSAETAAQGVPDAKPAARTQQQTIPSLYID